MAEPVFEHTDRHGDQLRLVVPTVGGFTIQVGKAGRHQEAVWLSPETAAELAAALTDRGAEQ